MIGHLLGSRYVLAMTMFFAFWFSLFIAPPSAGNSPKLPTSAVVYYGENPPIEQLKRFNHIIIESDQINQEELKSLQSEGNSVYAYLSLGEFESWRSPQNKLAKHLNLSHNSMWNSTIVDVSHPDWHRYILEERVSPLIHKGHTNLFLDTLDSYKNVISTPDKLKKMEDGLVKLIHSIKDAHPELNLFINRGFELLPQINKVVNGIVVESLFRTFDKKGSEYTYKATTSNHQKQLLNTLKTIKNQYKLPIIVIDYLPQDKKMEAKAVAKKIQQAGFIPFVTQPSLDSLGMSSITFRPRKILAIYDSHTDKTLKLFDQPIFNYLGPVFDYYGYVIEYVDLHTQTLPKKLTDKYAGVVTWFKGPVKEQTPYLTWLKTVLSQGIPLTIFGDSGIKNSQTLSKLLGVKPLRENLAQYMKNESLSPLFDYEGTFQLKHFSGDKIPVLTIDKGCSQCESHASYELSHPSLVTKKVHGLVTASWGGWVQTPWILKAQPGLTSRWLIDPFEFLDNSLQLSQLPAPDVTTHLGRRLLMIHIDGDGFLNRAALPSTPYSSQVILDRVLTRFPVAHTVSVIEGEVGPKGMYRRQSRHLEGIAKEIFKLPFIEPASHTYCHPFNWQKLGTLDKNKKPHHLVIPGYHYEPQRDLIGSIKYLDTLLPEGKKTNILLWTGSALPKIRDLAILNKHGILNLNGGNTVARDSKNSLLYVSPMYRPVGPYTQVYAPIMNENVYTNDWTGPFYGFRNVIQTFKFTDKPRRLKPLNIYYHFYSGEKIAALNALIDVYQWSMNQEYFSIYASDYIKKVNNFFEIDIFSTLNDNFIVHNATDIQTFRVKHVFPPPSTALENGVLGYRNLHDGRYIHSAGKNTLYLNFHSQNQNNQQEQQETNNNRSVLPLAPFIEQANGDITEYQFKEEQLSFHFQGFHSGLVDIHHKGYQCVLGENDLEITNSELNSNILRLELKHQLNGYIRLKCTLAEPS